MRITILLLLISLASCRPAIRNNDYLVSYNDTVSDQYGYKNSNGDIVIPQGKYERCFTDTFKTYAIVVKPNGGFIAIDRQEKVLYGIFSFDNGPDYTSEGLFRIQTEEYKKSVIPENVPVYGLTAGLSVTLQGLVGPRGKVWGLNSFGYSAPYKILDEKFGFTAENVYRQVRDYLAQYKR